MLHSCPLTLLLLPSNLPPIRVPHPTVAPLSVTEGVPLKLWPGTLLSDMSP